VATAAREGNTKRRELRMGEKHLNDWLTREVTNMAAVSRGGNTTKLES
jgi:hypothetical protein